MVTPDALFRITGRRPDGVRVEAGWVPQSERRARRRRRRWVVLRPLPALPPATTITGVRVSRPAPKMLKAKNG
jgi:peptidoglycan/xylan/chitin deacetylase (PgdA/CDA1 family)